ncbi:sensor histidine kinase [Anatilimnocola floriformis]|uniref:sensor histidine kinase n=1 Tax=Anatilimnocola floriformis TaxID=2948575 RepID=UPI0020C21867|nr:sensor histidine kinase KdpD [Anatilimnocola floriformis]
MPEVRPNPDALLAQVQADEAEAKRGSLKVFFGYAAGVGKTYAMLENARRAKVEGREVVVGYVEPHGRRETEALLAGFETIPLQELDYRGVTLREFNVDAALARHPDLLLVDELAHTNAAGCRHEKRWQDVKELLAAGIDVWTTLNVQHIESLNDVIGQITGVVVRELVPDRVFDLADDLELIDITPEELLVRLKAGKVYLPEQAHRAIQSFFQKPNLNALRELSLRQAARRIHTDVESARREKSISQPWATSERLLVCVGPSPTTARVIRTARRMAAALDAPWLAVSVDLTGESNNSPEQQQVAQHFRIAERLGAETVTIAGQNVTATILSYARSRNVTKILIGKTNQPRWKRLLFGSVVDELLEQSAEIDVYVIHGEEEPKQSTGVRGPVAAFDILPYLKSSLLIALTGVAAYALQSLHFADGEANTVMLFLAAVAWSAFRYGRGPAILASALAVLAFDYFFVPPVHSFNVSDVQYVVTFAVMLAIGLAVSTLTSRLRAQVQSTRERERRTAGLYELGKKLSSLYGNLFLVSAAGRTMAEMVGGEVAIYLQGRSSTPELAFGQDSTIAGHALSLPVARWVVEHDQIAGAATNTLPSAAALFLPLVGSQRTHGAIAIRVDDAQRLLEPDVRRLLEACANLLALALERDQLAIDAAEARIQAEAEQVRSSLLSSVSHDLKTPLAAIAGASSSLLESESIDDRTRRQLLETVSDEAIRLNRLLENILQMSKLDAGAATPSQQWHVLEEIVGSALHRTARLLQNHPVKVNLPLDLPLVFIDGLLMEQVFVNLLENAARYTPAGTHVTIAAAVDNASLRIAVSDNGPGLPSGAEERVFEKFYRASQAADGGRGSGLGLAICRAIAKAHGGNITAANLPSGGAEFLLRLPLAKDAPQVVIE